jgi:hypothetical protein
MTVVNLKARADLNGQRCMTLRFFPASGRWAVVLCTTGECVRIKPDNLEAVHDPSITTGDPATRTGSHGRVFVFWGNAGWSRSQLLGEIAHGSWGMCRASAGDIITDIARRWESLTAPGRNRLVFAPVNEMTEDYARGDRTTAERAAPAPADALEQQEREQRRVDAYHRMAALLEGPEALIEDPAASDEDDSDH